MKYLKLYEDFSQNSPIGIIDSGYGGVAILKALRSNFPQYDYIFLGVSPNKTLSKLDFSESKVLVERGLQYLTTLECQTQLVACNTACTLIDNFPSNTINLIKETINYINGLDYNNLGVLATPVTINSGIYQNELPNVVSHSCDNWASLVEEMGFNTPEGIEIIKSDLNQLFNQSDIDTILLACTHYILLKPIIESLYPNINIISQDDVMVNYFSSHQITSSNERSCRWLTCGSSSEFDTEVKQLFGITTKSEQVII